MMWSSMVQIAQTQCPSLVIETTSLLSKFKELCFANCHKIYDQNYVTEEKICQLGELIMLILACINKFTFCPTEDHIKKFMSYYREKFPHATVLPKMHMLEEHVVPWLKKWHVGFGLLGEQGIESIHAHFNTLGRTYRSIHEGSGTS